MYVLQVFKDLDTFSRTENKRHIVPMATSKGPTIAKLEDVVALCHLIAIKSYLIMASFYLLNFPLPVSVG